jgi:hypothetical protein
MDAGDGGCDISPQDTQILTEDLGHHALKLSKVVISSDPPDIENLQELIQEIPTAGFGYSTPSMRELHQKLARAHLLRLDIAACLQVMLKIHQHPLPFTNRTTRYLAHTLLDTNVARRWPA